MNKKLRTGDRVKWELPDGESGAAVHSRVTGTMHLKKHQASASEDQPESLGKSSDKAIFPTEALNQSSV